MIRAGAILVAAGRSERFGGPVPKVLVEHAGQSVLAHALTALDRAPEVVATVLVTSDAVERAWREAGSPGGGKVARVVRGGATRQDSVQAGLAALPAGADVVLVHDGARPFVTPALVGRVAAVAARAGAAVPLLPVTDTIKRAEAVDGPILETVPREELFRAQTPQGFRREVYESAAGWAREQGVVATDDVALVEAALAAGAVNGIQVEGVEGEPANVKVTRAEDLPGTTPVRIGLGHDVHPLERGRRFVLAGVDVQEGCPDDERIGPVGHSDGDALTHAACDALLGALGLGDIGQHFPDTAPENAGRPSLEFLARVRELLADRGWVAVNLSAVVSLERPKLAPHSQRIREALAAAVGLPAECVGLTAKRGEGLGPVGEGRAVTCDVVALVERCR